MYSFSSRTLNQNKYIQNVHEKTNWAKVLFLSKPPTAAKPTREPMNFQFSSDGIVLILTFCFFFFGFISGIALLEVLDVLEFLEEPVLDVLPFFFFGESTITKVEESLN